MTYTIDSFPGRTISINGKPNLYFGGTSYLGLQTDSSYQELFVKNLKIYGTNYGASRKSNVQLSIFSKAEQYLSEFVGCPDCITLSSGYLAAQLVATTLNTVSHTLFYAPNSHSALHVPGTKPVDSFAKLNSLVQSHLKHSEHTPVVFLDSIDFQGYNYPSFEALKQLPLAEVILVVDDSHGIGIIEQNGAGTYALLEKLKPKELIVCSSLGKGFGIQAGAIFGSKERIQQFTNTSYFGGASPASPAALATLIDADAVFKKKRVLLQQNIQLFKSSLNNISRFQYIPNYPTFTFTHSQLVAHLETNEIIITNFKYPTEKDTLMSRIVLSASHTPSDIIRLAKTVNHF